MNLRIADRPAGCACSLEGADPFLPEQMTNFRMILAVGGLMIAAAITPHSRGSLREFSRSARVPRLRSGASLQWAFPSATWQRVRAKRYRENPTKSDQIAGRFRFDVRLRSHPAGSLSRVLSLRSGHPPGCLRQAICAARILPGTISAQRSGSRRSVQPKNFELSKGSRSEFAIGEFECVNGRPVKVSQGWSRWCGSKKREGIRPMRFEATMRRDRVDDFNGVVWMRPPVGAGRWARRLKMRLEKCDMPVDPRSIRPTFFVRFHSLRLSLASDRLLRFSPGISK